MSDEAMMDGTTAEVTEGLGEGLEGDLPEAAPGAAASSPAEGDGGGEGTGETGAAGAIEPPKAAAVCRTLEELAEVKPQDMTLDELDLVYAALGDPSAEKAELVQQIETREADLKAFVKEEQAELTRLNDYLRMDPKQWGLRKGRKKLIAMEVARRAAAAEAALKA